MRTYIKSSSLLLLSTLAFFSPVTSVVAQQSETIIVDSILHLPSNVDVNRRYLVGAVSTTSAEDMEKYPELILNNTMQGKLLGLTVVSNVGGLGNNASSFYVRGLHSTANNSEILTIVDGVPRSIDDLLPQEVATIDVIKDATAKILYGAQATNGAIVITTKSGYKGAPKVRISAEFGVGITQDCAEYLDSYNFAMLYNEARANDGLAAYYTDSDILGYKNSTGVNDVRYPNVDYTDYFLTNTNTYQRYTAEFNGSGSRINYSLIAGYTGSNGIEAVGDKTTVDKLNLRGNLAIKVNNFISAKVGIANIFEISNFGSKTNSSLFSAITTHRPNEYPLVIGTEYIAADASGNLALGASFDQTSSLYGDLLYGGESRYQNITGQVNVELDFDLSTITKGLSASASYAYDNFFYGAESRTSSMATYAQRWYTDESGVDYPVFYQMDVTETNDDVTLDSSYNRRSSAILAKLNYNRTFESEHRVDAMLSFYNSTQQYTGTTQDDKALNILLRANYAYRNRYILEASTATMGSNLYYGSNKYMQAWSAGLGWIASDEPFMSGLDKIDFLKVKASAGLLGYDNSTAYLYENRWANNGTYTIASSTTIPLISSTNVASEDLDWERSREYNVGFEASLFGNKLWTEFNYFNETRTDVVTQLSSDYSALYGDYYPYQNYGKVRNQGVEFEAIYSDRTSDLGYSVGLNAIYSKNRIIEGDSLYDPDSLANVEGNSTDSMYGYVSEGLFGRDVELVGHTTQCFGYYTEGDIAYADLNNDGLVTEQDQQLLGNSFPRVTLGLEVNLDYKGFGLYLQGTSQLGCDVWLNSSYYWVSGDDKYSAITADRYHPTNNPDGEYPRLTTTAGTNNYRNSDFWMESANFFKIKNMELSYTFGEKYNLGSLGKLKVFVRGTNLLTISKIKEFDPEVMTAGLANYPIFTTITGGVNLIF